MKYLIAYILPLSCMAGILWQGVWSWAAFVIAFVIIPIGDFFSPTIIDHLSTQEKEKKNKNPYYDWIVLLNIPLLYFLLYLFLSEMNTTPLRSFEKLGQILSMGTILGGFGINLGHELGHRKGWLHQIGACLLLLPNLYLHFTNVHNIWHHKWVATPMDPASAPKGMTLYRFLWNSISGNYLKGWELENIRIKRNGLPAWHNKMWMDSLLILSYLFSILILFSLKAMIMVIFAAIIGILLLESVNYVEHYGLRRKQLVNGRFEPVSNSHSWNSDHALGRIFLYELVLHTDHHMHASKKYQILEHVKGSPQLPYGYPSSIILAILPPIWFKIMDKKITN
jgi:alkane 1-monooxygenase